MNILREAGLTVTLFKIYVDDVRNISTVVKKGTRFEVEGKKMIWSEEYKKEDDELEKGGETVDARMTRVLVPAMNCINPDLVFTTELREDFDDGKLPTLDCKIWLEDDLTVNHTYFEKDMRSQLLIPERSAMSERQKINILSNDVIRRLSNMNVEKEEEGERIRIVDHFTSQLKKSGYSRGKSREIVVAGVKGWIRKRKEEEGKSFYRGAQSTLRMRMRRKLLDPVNWYKSKEGTKGNKNDNEKNKEPGTNWNPRKRKRAAEDNSEEAREEKKQKEEDPKSVLFCPFTIGSEPAKQMRTAEDELEKTMD